MKIDKGMYNDIGYEFGGKISDNVKWWFDVIRKLLFIGDPPYKHIELAYKLRRIVLFFYSKHNLIK